MPKDLVQLSRDLQKLKRELILAANRASEQTARDAIKVAQFYSSGWFRSAALAKPPWNNPYAWAAKSRSLGRGGKLPRKVRYSARGPIPFGDPRIINKQSGVFRRSWTYSNYRLPSGLIQRTIKNTDPVAKYLQAGTKRMVPRPIDELIAQYIRMALPINLERETRAAWTRAIGA